MNWLWTSCLTSSKCCQNENHQKGNMKHKSASHLRINDELYETSNSLQTHANDFKKRLPQQCEGFQFFMFKSNNF